MSRPVRTVAFILARAGSKGLPGKNIALLRGRPLIDWSIAAARECATVDRTVVSTDGEEISRVAQECGAEVMIRPHALATDLSVPKDAFRYHLEEMDTQPEIVILLQPTSPLRLPADIDACVAPLLAGEADSAATFVKTVQSPYRAWLDTENGPQPAVPGFNPWQPRQALPATYALNGAVYAVRTDVFLADASNSFLPGRARMVVMPLKRSGDIDTQADLDAVAAQLEAER